MQPRAPISSWTRQATLGKGPSGDDVGTRIMSRSCGRVSACSSAAHAAFQSRYLPASGVLDYRWSPDGRQIAFTAEPPIDPSIVAAAAKEGFRYDDSTMNAVDLTVGDWGSGHRSKQLWFYNVRDKREHMVWTTPSASSAMFTVLLWSPSGKKLAFFYATNGGAGSDSIGIVDSATSAVSEIGAAGGTVSSAGVAWSPDERAIAYLSRSIVSASSSLAISNVIDHSRKEQGREIYAGHSSWLAWDADRHRIIFLLHPRRKQFFNQRAEFFSPLSDQENFHFIM